MQKFVILSATSLALSHRTQLRYPFYGFH